MTVNTTATPTVNPHHLPRQASASVPQVSPWMAGVRYWTQTLNFTGRASRSEFWWSTLFLTLLGAGLYWRAVTVVEALNATAACGISYGCAPLTSLPAYHDYIGTAVIAVILALILVLPTMALMVRRLHDRNCSGHVAWLVLMPAIGWLALLALACGQTRTSPEPR